MAEHTPDNSALARLRFAWPLRLAALGWLGSAAALAASAGSVAETAQGGSLPPQLGDLFWALFTLFALVIGVLIWALLVRREARRKSGELARHGASLEAWYRDLFDNAHDILLSLDPDGRLLALNRAGRQILELNPSPDQAQPLVERVVQRDRAGFQTLLDRLRNGAETAYGEIELAAGKERRVVLRVNLRRQGSQGQPTQIQGVAWDVTEQRRAEDALRESEQRLRHSLEERIRIGRDLHDGIIQSIYAVGLSLGECRRAVEGSHPAAHQKLEHSIGELNRLIREVRDFIEGLEPEALKGREFRTALESIASSLAIPADLELELEIAPDAANGLTAQQAADLLHITREALSNTIRHSGAHHARVALTRALDAAQLTIQDDGCGFDPGRPHSTGLGLRNMESRARDHGGRREVRSAPGQGATLTITLPLRAPEPAP